MGAFDRASATASKFTLKKLDAQSGQFKLAYVKHDCRAIECRSHFFFLAITYSQLIHDNNLQIIIASKKQP